MRAQGLEVWFDQSELRGGDAWDQSIRQQIKECALLIPIISSNTEARAEGYFRLEWRLADQRTHLMARGTSFLLPVSFDASRDVGAKVPESFLDVQWTRLALDDAAALERFAERVGKVLNGRGSSDTNASNAPPALWSGAAALTRKSNTGAAFEAKTAREARQWWWWATLSSSAARAILRDNVGRSFTALCSPR